ncbi:hypothetical protein AVEN_59276-1 [Araneus ventricosus]|uniref:Uncharacterized protein n=1 Tax=Araneus ventricosus TaxID=182803 RepID=A0A4Y2G3G1_ARAVE|nr:hypothetical protein AVEN_59276-1 [Araneus ventricosus]
MFNVINMENSTDPLPDSTEDTPLASLLHVKSYIVAKCPPARVVRKFGDGVSAQCSSLSFGRGSKCRGPSQYSPRVASEQNVKITKLNLTLIDLRVTGIVTSQRPRVA